MDDSITIKYVSINDVADHYSVSVSTVRTWVRNRQITPASYLKVGNTYRFKISDVDRELRTKRDEPSTAPTPVVATPDPKAPVQLELNFNPDQDL
jgi:excisionase family DNA binding protein